MRDRYVVGGDGDVFIFNPLMAEGRSTSGCINECLLFFGIINGYHPLGARRLNDAPRLKY